MEDEKTLQSVLNKAKTIIFYDKGTREMEIQGEHKRRHQRGRSIMDKPYTPPLQTPTPTPHTGTETACRPQSLTAHGAVHPG